MGKETETKGLTEERVREIVREEIERDRQAVAERRNALRERSKGGIVR